MIDFNEAIIEKLIFHRVSNNDKISIVSDDLYEYDNEEEERILKTIFLKPFCSLITTYEFKHSIDIELNPLFQLSRSIYNGEDFIERSKDVFTHLKTVSKHPNIKDGELFVVKYEDVKFNDGFYEALGVYKIENKESFIQIDRDATGKTVLKFNKGIGSKRLDKACLILFTDKPYTVSIIDNANKDTDYWMNEFICAKYKNDFINNTNHFLQLTKEFVQHELPNSFEVSKADQVDFLNKSVKFFKENDAFDMDEFANEVIAQPEVIDSFNRYKDSYQRERDIEISDSFTISDSAVKKQARVFKSVIKLDKNFHIYVHGDRNLIEQGEDDKGKYYKVYYKEES